MNNKNDIYTQLINQSITITFDSQNYQLWLAACSTVRNSFPASASTFDRIIL